MFVLVLLAACNKGGGAGALSPFLPVEAGYNVVIISFDALRADRLGVYGYDRNVSPRIDQFAKDALVFERAVTAGKDTPSSFAAAYTGELPFRIFRAWELQHVPTLASIFQQAGYSTAAVFHNVQLAPERGFDQGFSHYQMLHSADQSDFSIVKAADAWLKQKPEKPFLLWVHFISPHSPYDYRDIAGHLYESKYSGRFEKSSGGRLEQTEVLSPADHQRLIDLYDGEVVYADWIFGQMIDVLKARDAWNKSIVIVTSDHGESFNQHGRYQHSWLHQEVLQIPLIIRHPAAKAAGRTDVLYSNVDLLPTLADMLELDYPEYLDGTSLVSSPWAKRPIVSVAMTDVDNMGFSVRVESDKLIVRCDRHKPADRVALYDLEKDPREENNLLKEAPRRSDFLYADLQAQAGAEPCASIWKALNGTPMTKGLDEERIEQLRSLGYIQ